MEGEYGTDFDGEFDFGPPRMNYAGPTDVFDDTFGDEHPKVSAPYAPYPNGGFVDEGNGGGNADYFLSEPLGDEDQPTAEAVMSDSMANMVISPSPFSPKSESQVGSFDSPITNGISEEVNGGENRNIEGLQQNPVTSPPEEEVEDCTALREWEQKHQKELEQKRKQEDEEKQRQREVAREELVEWYARRKEKNAKAKAAHHLEAQQSGNDSGADQDLKGKASWDRVASMIDFTREEQARDTSRMKQIILQLKNQKEA